MPETSLSKFVVIHAHTFQVLKTVDTRLGPHSDGSIESH